MPDALDDSTRDYPGGPVPPIPRKRTRRETLSAADRRMVRLALATRGRGLPDDWPDLTPLIDFLESDDRLLPEGLRLRRAAVR